MPRNIIGAAPFEVKVIDSDAPLSLKDITCALGAARGVSICVRSSKGPAKRGGYFFHYAHDGDKYQIFDFEKHLIATLTPDTLLRLVNHASGRQFDDGILNFCQTVINFRQD